jgi:hypothetical protein
MFRDELPDRQLSLEYGFALNTAGLRSGCDKASCALSAACVTARLPVFVVNSFKDVFDPGQFIQKFDLQS